MEPKEEIVIGDVVCLNSGSAHLTVVARYGSECTVMWFDADKQKMRFMEDLDIDCVTFVRGEKKEE